MSEASIDVVHRFTDAFNRRDREAVGAVLHPELEWHSIAGPVFGIGTLQGREEVLGFLFERVTEVLEGFRVTLHEVTELADGQLLAIGTYEGRGVGSGAPVDMNTAAIYGVAGGTIRFFQDFDTRAEALQAAELRE
jgi:ketosteroid isomerase-like protein